MPQTPRGQGRQGSNEALKYRPFSCCTSSKTRRPHTLKPNPKPQPTNQKSHKGPRTLKPKKLPSAGGTIPACWKTRRLPAEARAVTAFFESKVLGGQSQSSGYRFGGINGLGVWFFFTQGPFPKAKAANVGAVKSRIGFGRVLSERVQDAHDFKSLGCVVQATLTPVRDPPRD